MKAPGRRVIQRVRLPCRGIPEYKYESVNRNVGEYVREQAHPNGIKTFWAMLKRVLEGAFHKISPKHQKPYVNEFAGK